MSIEFPGFPLKGDKELEMGNQECKTIFNLITVAASKAFTGVVFYVAMYFIYKTKTAISTETARKRET